MLEPMPVQSPFAAGRNQLVADRRLQDVQPVRPFARGRQRRKPELVQSQLIPQKSGHPAGTPLTRPTQSHLAQSDRHHIAIERRGNTILGKQKLVKLPSTVYWLLVPGTVGLGLAIMDAGVGTVGLPLPSLQKIASAWPNMTWLAAVPPRTD